MNKPTISFRTLSSDNSSSPFLRKHHSTMAAMTGLPTQDYGRYAVSHSLHHLHIDRPQLFEKLVKHIVNSLEDEYCFPPGYFPSSQSQENANQRAERNSMVQEWLGELDQQLGEDWPDRETAKYNTLNALFYAIWNFHSTRPTST